MKKSRTVGGLEGEKRGTRAKSAGTVAGPETQAGLGDNSGARQPALPWSPGAGDMSDQHRGLKNAPVWLLMLCLPAPKPLLIYCYMWHF